MAVLNISSTSDDWRAQRLSNFFPDAFILDGVRLTSVEGFIQGIKFPVGDPIRQEAFRSPGIIAKRLGKTAERVFVWWGDVQMLYRSGDHVALIERAIRIKFQTNRDALRTLRATKGLDLIHDTGRPESPTTSLHAARFCEILTQIREEQSEMKMLTHL